MIHTVDPRQNRLFDPFEGIIPPAGQRIIAGGWQGVFRHVLLEVMPVGELAQHFSREPGPPPRNCTPWPAWSSWPISSAGPPRRPPRLTSSAATSNTPSTWSPAEPSPRTVERYQKLFRDHDLAALIFHDVTTRLAESLELNISQQRLDSTHVFSHMASFGRIKLMAVAIKRFLTQVKRHAPESYAALPEAFRLRYQSAESQLFAGAKDAEARQRSRQQVAEDLQWIIEHFAPCADMTGRSSYKAMVTIFSQQCEVSQGKVVVKAKTSRDCVQNPSDLDASYDGHKGPGYQVQIAETCSPENEVQLITGALPQTACEPDGGSVVPMLDQLKESELLPEVMLADTLYCGDENVQAAETRGVEWWDRSRVGNRRATPRC